MSDNKADVELFDAQFHVVVDTGPFAGKSFYVDMLQFSFAIHDLNREKRWAVILKKQNEVWKKKLDGVEVSEDELSDATLPGAYFSQLLQMCKEQHMVPEYTTFAMVTELYAASLRHADLLKKKCAITQM